MLSLSVPLCVARSACVDPLKSPEVFHGCMVLVACIGNSVDGLLECIAAWSLFVVVSVHYLAFRVCKACNHFTCDSFVVDLVLSSQHAHDIDPIV
jgi:hypothetical protein